MPWLFGVTSDDDQLSLLQAVALVPLMLAFLWGQVWWALSHPPEGAKTPFRQSLRRSHRIQLWIVVPVLTVLLVVMLISAFAHAVRG